MMQNKIIMTINITGHPADAHYSHGTVDPRRLVQRLAPNLIQQQYRVKI